MTWYVPAPHSGGTAPSERVFRPELQGLRAVAVALVVVYHVWFDRVSGGVDVFFVLTGFLLTGQLLRAAERGSLDLRRHWGRTLSRLLPAALTVLLGTVVAGALVLPESRWLQTVREVVASGLFLQNWQLAADSVDYGAQHNAASVVQHFWSLSIQVQVMVVAPLLVALLALGARRATVPLRGRLGLVLAGVLLASLTYSVGLTATDQPFAYFHTLTRLWEFAAGGLLALVLDRYALVPRLRLAAGWVGLAGLVACGLVLQVGSVFPGYAALWPTSCAALVLLAGRTGSRWGADRILASRPLRVLGDLSYPLYLWHWPVLVLALVGTGRDRFGPVVGLLVIAVSLVLAVLTRYLVERPMRDRSGRGTRRLAAAGMAVLLVAAGGWQVAAMVRTVPLGTSGDAEHPGAQALHLPDAVGAAPLLPPPAAVYEDWVRIERWECAPLPAFPRDVCRQPVTEPERRIVVVGDSHAQQFIGALAPVAERAGWQLIAMVLGACPYSTASEVDPENQDCLDWNDAVAAEIAETTPDAVVTLATRDVRAGLTELTPPGFVDRWRELDDLGIPVLAVRDNPRFDFSPPDCIQKLGRSHVECGVERAAVYAPDPPYTKLSDVPPNVSFLDIADLVCDDTYCPAETGNVLVYLDDNHLSATYTASMAGLVEEQMRGALGG